MKKILFILKKPPHKGAYTQETLDFIMTVAAFDHDVSLLLLDHAVFQLKHQQNITNSGLKDTTSLFKALSIYNVQNLYVEQESLQMFGLTREDLSETVSIISRLKVGDLIKQFDLVLPA